MPVARAIHRIKSCHREYSPRTRFTGIERPVLGRNHDPHVGVSWDRIMGEACLAIALALGNGRCGGTIRRVLDELASDGVLDTAYDWLCKRRRGYPPDADIWSFRHRWREEKAIIKTALLKGSYRFGLLTRVTLNDGEDIDLWSARDALVLKALALVLGEHLPISPRCTHVKGHGGGKAAVRQVRHHLAENRIVLRTDVKSYYASIDHFLLMDQLAGYIGDRRRRQMTVVYP